MIHKLKSGVYRVRYAYGHEQRYTKLKRIENPSEKVQEEIAWLEEEWGLPNRINVRRSCNCIHHWQALEIEELFKAAHALEVAGKKVPKNLLKFELAPARDHYLDELGYFLASICGFKVELIDNVDFDIFLEQSDANENWIKKMHITSREIVSYALSHCKIKKFKLEGKTVLFTGSVCGFTGDSDYLKCLKKMALEMKVDAIITAGPWIKAIFLHKTSSKPNILPALKELAKEVKIVAIRSNRDKPEHLHELKELGIHFINGIEDDKNVFTGISTSNVSTKNQLTKFEEAYPGKNVFFYSTFVGIKSQATEGGGLRYLTGSGSSGYNTPRARVWANAYDSQLLHSGIRDSIGGHVLRFDKKGNVFPTTFRYHTELKAILNGGIAYFKNKAKEGNLHVLLSDFHAGTHHKRAFAGFLKYLEDRQDQIKTLILNGDFLDNLVLCHHNKGQILSQIEIAKRDMDFLKEIAYAKECLKLIVSKVKSGTRLVFKLGNHEVNSFKKFLQRDINHFLHSLLEIDTLLGLSSMGFEIVSSKVAYKLGDIVIHHGHEMHRTQAKKTFGKKSVRGHSHGLLIDSEGMTLSGMEDRDKTDYLFNPYVNWTVGFAATSEYDEHYTMPEPVIISKNKYADYDGLKSVKEDVEIPLPKKLVLEYDIEWTGREGLS